MSEHDVMDEAEFAELPSDGEDEDLNETQALYRDFASSYHLPEDLTVEVIPMSVGEVTCPSCFLVVPAASVVDGRCRECQ